MKTLTVFDPAMCCSTGVCGSDVDQVLVDFSADVQWLKGRGVQVERYNLAQQPMSFVQNEKAKAFLEASGAEGLPLPKKINNCITFAIHEYYAIFVKQMLYRGVS